MHPNEVAVHIDFSENYSCKYAKEVQPMHWGAFKPQITIHTGVIYAKYREPQTFASISPNNEHGPQGIWAHLIPVLCSKSSACGVQLTLYLIVVIVIPF